MNMMNTKDHEEHLHKKMHEILEHYNRKQMHNKISSKTFEVKTIKQLAKEM
jgi:hypothetical protein